MIDETIESVRRISRDLMPSTLEKFGFGQAIQEMCDQYKVISGIDIKCVQQEPEMPVEKSKALIIFRIVQELLNNAMKHSKASSILVTLQWGSQLHITVEDNGIGFNYDEKKSLANGLGLFNMQNRTRMLDALLQFEANRTVGTSAKLSVPLT
jgi:signal transduction histidine kinase